MGQEEASRIWEKWTIPEGDENGIAFCRHKQSGEILWHSPSKGWEAIGGLMALDKEQAKTVALLWAVSNGLLPDPTFSSAA